jgi:hypothetical protein
MLGMDDTADKVRANRARRIAARRGYNLRRSRTRDPLAVDYGWHLTRGRQRHQFHDLAALEHWLDGQARRDRAIAERGQS